MESTEYLKKPYARMVFPESDGSFRGEILEFPGCVAIGDNPADALENVEETAVDWINAALEQGQNIPEPMESAGFSGKLVLRMPKGLHKKAAQFAEREDVSLNQFIVTCVAEHVGMRASPRFQVYASTAPTVNVIGVWINGQLSSGPSAIGSSIQALTPPNPTPTLIGSWERINAGG
jgi:predicted HicB family RNase H-like nuclease